MKKLLIIGMATALIISSFSCLTSSALEEDTSIETVTTEVTETTCATVNVEIQDYFEEFSGEIYLSLRTPIGDEIKTFKSGVFGNVTYDITDFGECSFVTTEPNAEWTFVDSETLKPPIPFVVKENDLYEFSLLLYPTEKNKLYGDYVRMYENAMNTLANNDVISSILGVDNSDISLNRMKNTSNSFEFEKWHDGAMESYDKFKNLFSAIEDDETWQAYLNNAEIRRNISATYYVNSVDNGKESDWQNMSKSDILMWQDTYLVFVEMIDKGSEYFNKTFASQQSKDKWLKSIIGTSAWTGNNADEICDAYVSLLDYQIEYYSYYGYPYNFINDKSYNEETKLFSSSESEKDDETEEIKEELSDEDIREFVEDDSDNKKDDKTSNWKDVFEKIKKNWLTIGITVIVAIAYLIVRKIRKSKNYDEES